MRASGSASRRSSKSLALIEQILDRLPAGRSAATAPTVAAATAKGMALVEGFRGDVWPGCGSAPTARSRAATCAIRPGSSGRCWRPPSRATSSPTSRSATNPSTAPTRATTSRHAHAQAAVPEPAAVAAHRGARPRRTTRRWPSWRRALERAARRRLGRSLSIREVDAGSCNGCELEIHALNNAFYDLERFGLRFVASPRHADVLLVTGPVTKNMREALERTYHATPNPKWVVAVGDCAINCGVFAGSYAFRARSPPWCRWTCAFRAARRRRPLC